MRTLTQKEKRTVRLGAYAVAIYLVVFFGVKIGSAVVKRHSDYELLLAEVQNLKRKVVVYQAKVQHIQKLMESFRLDPAKLTRASVLAQASAAIQSAALGGGVQIGPVRESPARPSTK